MGPLTNAAKQKSSWFLSSAVVAAGVAATGAPQVFLGSDPGGSDARSRSSENCSSRTSTGGAPGTCRLSTDPLSKAVEVTGVRFVTGIPDRRPELHYLVVNHSNVALTGIVVNVTLRSAPNPMPVAQFSFRTPRMNAFESKEMVSPIERVNTADLPDWRRVKAEIHIVQ